MRTVKLCLAVGLAVAMSAAALGVTPPSIGEFYTFYEMTNHTNGNTYSADLPGVYTRNEDGTWSGPGTLDVIRPAGAWDDDEDTWGVFAVERIQEGLPEQDLTGNTVSMAAMPGKPDTYKWTQAPGDAGTGLVGMVYGGRDVQVDLRADGSFQVWTEDLQIELWAVDSTKLFFDAAGTLPVNHEGPAYDASRRTAENAYENWLDPDDDTKIPLLRLETDYHFVDGAVNQLGYFNGGAQIYADIVGDPDVWQWNDIISGTYVPALFTYYDERLDQYDNADVWLDYELKNDTGYGWLAKSNDDGGMSGFVPEPLTVLVMGLGGLGVCLKRRRRA